MTPPKETRRAEGRGRPGGSLQGEAKVRTQGRGALPPNLMRVNEAARRDKRTRFTALLHHVDVAALERAFRRVKRSAAPGVDGETVESYEGNLQERLKELCDRVHRGSYRPKPVRRVYIPKAGGGQRPIGVPTLEDKVVQGAVAEMLSAIYEVDFLGFSYGFRPGRHPHGALQALHTGLMTQYVNWVLDADIRSFFDSVDHEWMLRMVALRVADRRLLRLIRQWLRAGVMEGLEWRETLEGTPQGAGRTPPTQSQTLPGTGSCPIRDSCIKNIEADDIGNSTLTTHERSAARAICPVRRARESSARPARAVPPGGDSAHTGSPVSRISSPGPAVCGSGAAASRGITRAGGDGGVHREASGQSGAAAPGTGADHGGKPQFARHARARRLAAASAARTRRWRIGASSTTTCLTAWAVSG